MGPQERESQATITKFREAHLATIDQLVEELKVQRVIEKVLDGWEVGTMFEENRDNPGARLFGLATHFSRTFSFKDSSGLPKKKTQVFESGFSIFVGVNLSLPRRFGTEVIVIARDVVPLGGNYSELRLASSTNFDVLDKFASETLEYRKENGFLPKDIERKACELRRPYRAR